MRKTEAEQNGVYFTTIFPFCFSRNVHHLVPTGRTSAIIIVEFSENMLLRAETYLHGTLF